MELWGRWTVVAAVLLVALCCVLVGGQTIGGGKLVWREEVFVEALRSSVYEVRFTEFGSTSNESIPGLLQLWDVVDLELPPPCQGELHHVVLEPHTPQQQVAYVSCFNQDARIPNWVLYPLSRETMGQTFQRDVTPWRTRLFPFGEYYDVYDGNGDPFNHTTSNIHYERGQLVPFTDLSSSRTGMDSAHHVLNRYPSDKHSALEQWHSDVAKTLRSWVFKNRETLLVYKELTGTPDYTRTVEETTSNLAMPGRQIWIPEEINIVVWRGNGDNLAFQSAEYIEGSSRTVSSNRQEEPTRLPSSQLEFLGVNNRLNLAFEPSLLSAGCDPYTLPCRLESVKDCRTDGYPTELEMQITSLENSWRLDFRTTLGGACDPSCRLVPEEIIWDDALLHPNVTTELKMLKLAMIRCLRKPFRTTCFTEGGVISKTALKELPPLEELAATVRGFCGQKIIGPSRVVYSKKTTYGYLSRNM